MKKEPLQNLTKRNAKKVETVLAKEKILPEDVKPLTREQREMMEQKINEHLNSLRGEARNQWVEKIEAIVPGKTDLRSQQWEVNHAEIGRVISNFMLENKRPPTKSEIAKETDLSRQTIHTHLIEFENSPFYDEERKKLRMLNHKLLTKVYQFASTGNVKACRLYFEMTGALNRATTKNFYIQINNIRVDENLIRQLPPQAIADIENIILKSIPEPMKQLNKQI